MAKQAVGVFERHVEKAVLGICAILLIGVIVLYGVMSPNKAKIGMNEVSPDSVYREIVSEANRVQGAFEKAVPPPPPEGGDPVEEIKEHMDDLLEVAGVSPVLLPPVLHHPKLPFESSEPGGGGKIELVQVPAPTDLKVFYGRTFGEVMPPIELSTERTNQPARSADFDSMIGFNWVSISCLFNQLEVERLCREKRYAVGRLKHPIVSLDVQRREVLEDGTMKEWEDVNLYYPTVLPEPPEIVIDTSMGNPRIPADVMRELGVYSEMVRREAVQIQLMRPLFPFPEAGDCWKLPEYDDLDPVELDATYGVEDRYADLLCAEESTREPSDREICQEAARKAKRALELRTSLEALQKALSDIEPSRLPSCDRSSETELESLREQLEQEIDKMKDEQDRGIERVFAEVPMQILWCHDGPTGILVGDKTYQYRARVNLFNRYCGLPVELKDPQDGARVLLKGTWSEPSDPVYISSSDEFFLTNYSASKGRLKTDVFKWVKGYWKKQTFYAVPGDYLGGIKRTRMPDGDRISVDYNAGNLILDVTGEQTFRPVDVDKRTGGVTVEQVEQTTSMVYLSPSGEVLERYLAEDKANPERKEYQKKASAAPAGEDRESRKRDRDRKDQGRPDAPGAPGGPGRPN